MMVFTFYFITNQSYVYVNALLFKLLNNLSPTKIEFIRNLKSSIPVILFFLDNFIE